MLLHVNWYLFADEGLSRVKKVPLDDFISVIDKGKASLMFV